MSALVLQSDPQLVNGLGPASAWPMGQRAYVQTSLGLDLQMAMAAPVDALVARLGGAAVPLMRSTSPSAVAAVNLEALLFRQWRQLGGGPLGPLVDLTLLPALRASGLHLDRVLLLSTPLSYECSPFFAPGVERRAAFLRLIEALGGYARESNLTLAALDPAETGCSELAGVFKEAGFLPVLLLDEYRMVLGTGDFSSGYLEGLPARTRNDIRRERRIDAQAETVPLAALGPRDRSRMVQLYRETCSRHGRGWVDMDLAQLDQIADISGTWVSLARKAGEIACFGLFFSSEHSLFCWRSGRDEAHRGLYFEVAYYQCLEFALSRGIRQISWSFMSGATKRRRGATRMARLGWIWHPRQRALRLLLRPWLSAFSRGAAHFYDQDAE